MYQVKSNTDGHYGIYNDDTGDWYLVGKQKEHLESVVEALDDGLLYRSLSPALVDAIQVLMSESNINGKNYGREEGNQAVYDYLGKEGMDCCLGNAPPLEGEYIGKVRYCFEAGDRSVGINDYSYFELELAPGFKIVRE
jgi:hypothetical protein